MKAVAKVRAEFGVDVIDLPIPQPMENEVLIKVKNAGICGSDVHIYEWTSGYEYMSGLLPLVIGHEFAGEVVDLNPPPKIEFRRYCKGLYANFIHPLVKKKIL